VPVAKIDPFIPRLCEPKQWELIEKQAAPDMWICCLCHMSTISVIQKLIFGLLGSCQNQDSEESRKGDNRKILHPPNLGFPHKQAHMRGDRYHSQQAP
jgi:hypothetical protein